jgi:hypothetical protein
MRRLATALAAAVLIGSAFTGTVSASFPQVITLPGAISAEGIATGAGSTFYAGDLVKGDVYRGNLRSGSIGLFINAPEGRMAFGMKADVSHGLLFVAGGLTGQAYVYDLRTGADVAVIQLADPSKAFTVINDVVVTKGAAWFTESEAPTLYRVPIGSDGSIGAPAPLTVTGPAANIVPAVQNFMNQVTEFRLSPDLSSVTPTRIITNPNFHVPATVARHGNRIAVVNAKFDLGFPPPIGTSFEVVVVKR